MSASNIQVAIKVRPILRKEKEQKLTNNWKVAGNSIRLVGGQSELFYFDHIFDEDVCNQTMFDTMAKQIVDSGLTGFNGTIFAYGQTSSGKTYTMIGDEENPGVMVLAIKEIFKEIEKATDRQFLLRVGYIEIYNEKIYDLLNKSNQDLKIHETPNGDVSVNCSEYIITCEQDLLSYLIVGSKQRKIGETNVNERSSRSHAIFRITIESRKTDKTDDDSVQISNLNLVDLAGSERADITGATGSRLKEGGHINKSLLFLSCVIKQLAEDKYVSYRDSKLTRILQASLGGNALTAIICTINPTAVEESLSTLSFANRAKVVKNKPQVNEVLTDTAMMKRLEKEINRLQNELEVEKTKNSQIKVGQLQKRINEEFLKIINSNSSYHSKAAADKRRRTWCPSSVIPPLVEENSTKTELCPPQSTMVPSTKLQLPKSGMNFTPLITLRDVYYQNQLKEIECSPNIDEEFIPAEEVCFDDALTPQTSPLLPKTGFHTPMDALKLRTASLTPRLTEKESLQKVQQELTELEAFTNLEKKLNVEHDTYNTLKYKLENAERIIARYEKEREDFAFIKFEHTETVTNLSNCSKRCQELESKVIEFENAFKDSTERVDRYEKEITDLKAKITQLEMENRDAVSLEFEFQQHKNKAKRRETELLDALEEKQKEINKLERNLRTKTIESLNNSKEELQQQISRNLNETESVCVNCKYLQGILDENKKLTQDIEKANLKCQELELNLEKINSEAESAKLRADSLETENDRLKKDNEHLKSLHETIGEIQNEITSLQAEKCKLESVKIEFEVMSKETANKIAEKINISQEIQSLSAQRDALSVECNKLLADIAANGCSKEELNKLRSENDALHSELQKIKTKLENAQSDYDKLMIENQKKSENYEHLNMEVLSMRNQLQALQTEYRDIQQKNEQIQAECNKHEGTIGEIQSEYDIIQNKYQNLQREYEKLENDSVQSIADCDRVQNQNENLETEIRELKTKVEEAQRKLLENDSLQLELESLKSEMNRLQVEYDKNVSLKAMSVSPSKEESNADLRQENAKLKHDLENLQLQFDEMQKEYDEISTQLVDTFSDYETLQSEVAKLEGELKEHKESTVMNNLPEDFKAMKLKTEQLQVENLHLAKENAEWKKTISSMTKTMRDKCDEREQLVAQLEEAKNESLRSESGRGSADSVEQFIQLAESIVEIEIPMRNGISKAFQTAVSPKNFTGNKLIIGNISGITQGAFNELRGAIEFAVVADEKKSGTEMYDSLEIEGNSTGVNSCDSLEDPNKQSNDKEQINDLIEEKSRLFEKIRELEEAIAVLKIENNHLSDARRQLDETDRLVEALNDEKIYLSAVCDESKCKISELNEIISRAECDNKKLIADCEQLKKTVESECAVETVSREVYEDLKRQHEETCQQLLASDKKWAKLIEEYDGKCAELKGQLVELISKSAGEAFVRKIQKTSAELEKLSAESDCKCEEYADEISKLKAMMTIMAVELEKFREEDADPDMPVREELEETITELHEQLQSCKCIELQAALDEKTQELAGLGGDNSSKYQQEIRVLLEQLKHQECENQEAQVEIIELKTSLEGKTQESAEITARFEELNGRYRKLQTECEELQSVFSFQRKKSLEAEKPLVSLEKMEEECNLLQSSVACLSETVTSLGEERNDVIKQKEILEKEYNALSEKLLILEDKYDSLKRTKPELGALTEKLKILEEKNEILKRENMGVQEALLQLEQQRKDVTEECQILKNSERSLHEQLQKIVQDHELIVRDKERLERECHLSNNKLEILKDGFDSNSKEKLVLQRELQEMEERLNNASVEKKQLLVEFEEAEESKKELENKLDKALAENKQLQVEYKDANERKDEFEEKLNKASIETKQLQIEFENAKEGKEELEKKLDQISTEKDKLQVELKEAKESKDELKEKLNKSLAAAQQLQVELENSKERKDELEKKLDQISTEKDNLHDELKGEKERNEELEELEEKLNKTSAEKKQLQAELEEAKRMKNELKEIEEKLNKVLAEKRVLQVELEDAKEKKDKHETEKALLEEKCSSLTAEMHALTTTKNELQSALDRAKSHSEFLLQQGKDLEEQFNLELRAVRNSNNTMTQQIDELHNKLEKTESELKVALDKAHSEKDELVTQLTNRNNLFVTKSSELEEKFTLLEQKLEEATRCLSAETTLKETLEKGSSQKDELIAELSKKNNSLIKKTSELEEKFAFLEKQFEDSKLSLSTEKHLKEVLEKANSERDDLIVQLTNNNNSLATKSSELEEKLAILGNQFEESKKHFSAEVNKLNQLLSDANNKSNTQNSKIEDLKSKIEDLEGDLKQAQIITEERDSLLEKINQFKVDYDALAVKNANLELSRSSVEAELNSARIVVVENASLTQKMIEMESALKEAQMKCSSLSSANKELEMANKAIAKQLEDTTQQSEECKRLSKEIANLREDLEKAQSELKVSAGKQNTISSEWESKERSFVDQILQLQSKVATLTSEKKTIQEKLENAENTSLTKIAQLEQQIQLLQKEQSTNFKKSISPKKDKAIDHLMGESHQSKLRNMSLMDKLDSCQKSQNEERKIRRLSTHDERRLQSFWDSNRDVSTMTDPTNVECSCAELDRKLNELKQRLLIRDSQVNTLSMELKNHPLKTENATLKNILKEEESKQQQLRQEIKKYKQLVVNRTNEARHCAKCAEMSSRIYVESTTQTNESDDSECYRKLLAKYEDLKMICRVRHTKIKELEDALSTGKENTNDNYFSHHNHQYKQKYELLKKEFKTVQGKYEEAKFLCNMRYEQIKELSSKLSESNGNS